MISYPRDQLPEKDNDIGELKLISNQIVHLYGKYEMDPENQYRLIIAERKEKIDTTPPNTKGRIRKKENTFYFFTNNLELSPEEIADIYKQRWDIEVFFRARVRLLHQLNSRGVDRHLLTTGG
jgi:IS4 transposase